MDAAATDLVTRLPDGRLLGYARYGTAKGHPFFYCHGLPGSRLEGRLLHSAAEALGLCVYAVDRPGYGRSGFLAGRRMLDWPHDLAALADSLGIERFGLLGVSGGGPFVLACAHRIPQRLDSVGIVCGLGPVSEPALRQPMHLVARSAFHLAGHAPALLRKLYGCPLNRLARSHPALPFRLLARLCGGADRAVLRQPRVLQNLADSLAEAFRQGPDAALEDVTLYQQPWGFEPGDIQPPIHLWHGDADTVVPCLHSEWLHERLPHSSLTRVPGAGHFSLPVLHAHTILKALQSFS